MNTATDVDSAMNQLQASTGATAEETERYRQVMELSLIHIYGVLIDEDSGEEYPAEIHWFQEETVGKVKFKVKRWLDES